MKCIAYKEMVFTIRKSNTRRRGCRASVDLMQGQIWPSLLSALSYFYQPVQKFAFVCTFRQLFPRISLSFAQTGILAQDKDEEEKTRKKGRKK